MCHQSALILNRLSKVHVHTGGRCKLSALSVFLCLLSLCRVAAGCCSLAQRPRAPSLSLHTPFVWALSRSFHRPSASSPSGERSSILNWTGELLLAKCETFNWPLKGWTGGKELRNGWGGGRRERLTKLLSFAPRKAVGESLGWGRDTGNWRESQTTNWILSFTVTEELLVLFFFKDAGKPWNRNPPRAN